MKKILCAIIFIILPVLVYGQLNGSGTYGDPWSGTLDGAATWSGTKYIDGDITVDNEKLTISAGAIIIFLAEAADLIINGTGRLEAIGTSGSLITVTADDDDDGAYGEAGERWGHIVFNNPSSSNLSELEYCIIEYGDVSSGSHVNSYGGGVCSNIYSNLTLTNCTVRYNKATHGGGIMALSGSSPTISNCLISENTAITSGGGIYLHTNCTSTLTNCIVNTNSAGVGGGGGIFLDGCGNVDVVNSIVVDNTTTGEDRAYNIQYYNISSTTTRPSFKNCITWSNNNSISYRTTTMVSTDFVNCGMQDVVYTASYFSNCIDLNATNDNPAGPNFEETDGTDWSIKVISPCRDAGTDTGAPTTDFDGNSRVGTTDIGAYEVQYNGWKTTATSTSWTLAGNWTQGVPIGSSENIVIRTGASFYPTSSSSQNYTIGADYGMVLDPGAQATFGTLTTTGDLRLRSDASNISSLIINSTDVSAIVDIYLTGGGTSTTYKWHYISSPFSTSPSITPFTDVTLNLVEYIESLCTSTTDQGWVAYDGYIYKTGGDNDTEFTTLLSGKGYNFYDNLNNEISISGNLAEDNDVDFNLIFSNHGASVSGFNLLGNPFPSGLDWDEIIDDASYPDETSKGVYFTRNNAQCTYINDVGVPSDVTGIIPPMQGFFTKTYSTGNTITLLADARTHNSIHARYKGKSTIPLVRLSITKDTLSDETVVRFDEQAKPDLDNDFDALKMFLSDEKISIYSFDGETKYAINGLPFPEDSMNIQLAINTPNADTLKITATQIDGLEDYGLILKDLDQDFSINLNEVNEYMFTADSGTVTDRFILTVYNNVTGLPDIMNPEPEKAFNIYSSRGILFINPANDEWNGKRGNLRIYDIAGRIVKQQKNIEWYKGVTKEIPLSVAQGIYFVEIRAGGLRYVGKVSTGY